MAQPAKGRPGPSNLKTRILFNPNHDLPSLRTDWSLFRNLIAALLKREPKDRPSLDSILRRGYIQKVSSWLTDGPPRSILPSTSKSARRRRGGPAGASISARETENVSQDRTSEKKPKQALKDIKKKEQKSLLIRKAEPQSSVKVVQRQKSGKQRANVQPAEKETSPSQSEKRGQNPMFFQFKPENEKFLDKPKSQNLRNPKNVGFNQGGRFEVEQASSGIRGGQLMRTQENLKMDKRQFDGNQDHSGIRGGQLMRTQENPGVHEPSQNQFEQEQQRGPTQGILEHGVRQEGDSESLQRNQFHRPWEMSSPLEGAPASQMDSQGVHKSWWTNPTTNEPLYHEQPSKPARVTSSLGFTRAANQMTDEELRQVLERPRSNPTILQASNPTLLQARPLYENLQARPPYQSFSASYFPYSQLQPSLSLSWDQHSHGGMSQVADQGGNQEFYERQLAAQRFKERERDDMFDRHQETRMATKSLYAEGSVVRDSVSKDGALEEQQYLEELKNIRVDHSIAKKELERRREREKEELDSWVDMSQDGGKGTQVLRRRGTSAIDEGTKVLRRSGQMDGEKTFTVPIARPDKRVEENTYLIFRQNQEWWEKEERGDFLGEKHTDHSQPTTCEQRYDLSESGPDDELGEEVWWEEERESEKVKPLPGRAEELSESKQKSGLEHEEEWNGEDWGEDGERESQSEQRLRIGMRDNLKLEPQQQYFDRSFEEEEEEDEGERGEEDKEERAEEDVRQRKEIENTSAEPGGQKLARERKSRCGRRLTGIPIHDR